MPNKQHSVATAAKCFIAFASNTLLLFICLSFVEKNRSKELKWCMRAVVWRRLQQQQQEFNSLVSFCCRLNRSVSCTIPIMDFEQKENCVPFNWTRANYIYVEIRIFAEWVLSTHNNNLLVSNALRQYSMPYASIVYGHFSLFSFALIRLLVDIQCVHTYIVFHHVHMNCKFAVYSMIDEFGSWFNWNIFVFAFKCLWFFLYVQEFIVFTPTSRNRSFKQDFA